MILQAGEGGGGGGLKSGRRETCLSAMYSTKKKVFEHLQIFRLVIP